MGKEVASATNHWAQAKPRPEMDIFIWIWFLKQSESIME